jgi:hypothetical protein
MMAKVAALEVAMEAAHTQSPHHHHHHLHPDHHHHAALDGNGGCQNL